MIMIKSQAQQQAQRQRMSQGILTKDKGPRMHNKCVSSATPRSRLIFVAILLKLNAARARANSS